MKVTIKSWGAPLRGYTDKPLKGKGGGPVRDDKGVSVIEIKEETVRKLIRICFEEWSKNGPK